MENRGRASKRQNEYIKKKEKKGGKKGYRRQKSHLWSVSGVPVRSKGCRFWGQVLH